MKKRDTVARYFGDIPDKFKVVEAFQEQHDEHDKLHSDDNGNWKVG